VNRHRDRILAADTEQARTEFREGLWRVDGYALRKHEKPFASRTPREQTAIVEAVGAGGDPEIEPGRRFFEMSSRQG
jgi:hypothetical protein